MATAGTSQWGLRGWGAGEAGRKEKLDHHPRYRYENRAGEPLAEDMECRPIRVE